MSKTTRPSSISELAALTLKEVQWNPEKGFKHWVLVADKAGSTGRKCLAERDYERAFVEYGKASIIVLKKLPTHPDYERYLTTEQRRNMRLVSHI
ncbi:hypothetical protein OBBRIDRAFT_737262 [Obba rivulosa]|uniref:Uncharacterized protein n=1 Tax=Obba rivulosa TaxID=1052685 RepID=A0A8E2ARI8_9APHY|nr:hypothetical protein OBBRIDRAFT_737262 [Obba rivulosa]